MKKESMSHISTDSWHPTSWRKKPLQQGVAYADLQAVEKAENRLRNLPPLVFESELSLLQSKLAQVEAGEAFLLQGGDCAETFADLEAGRIRDSFQILLQMAVVLTFGIKRPVVKVGRMAGQFAKPRSSTTEIRSGQSLPVFRGEIINGYEFNEAARTPDPARMVKAYFHSAATLNLIRALAKGGYADLRNLQSWNSHFVNQLKNFNPRYNDIVARISEALEFMSATGLDQAGANQQLSTVDFFTSHEALLLNYEESLVRPREDGQGYYSGSAHMLWVGERTRSETGAHIEFAKGLSNPLGLKCGPEIKPDELLRVIQTLNPKNEPGRLTLIIRMGAKNIEAKLPKLIRRVQGEGLRVIWCSDPMHGNTVTSSSGVKTRAFTDILSEVQSFFAIHKAEGSFAGGVHFELTGRNVTECIGGAQDIRDSDLTSPQYESVCDPRLNASQSLELALALVGK